MDAKVKMLAPVHLSPVLSSCMSIHYLSIYNFFLMLPPQNLELVTSVTPQPLVQVSLQSL